MLTTRETTDSEAPLLDLHLSVSPEVYNKRDDFDFHIVNFAYLYCEIHRCISLYTLKNFLILSLTQ